MFLNMQWKTTSLISGIVPSGKYNFESDGMYYASSGTRFAAWDYISYNEIVITFESDGRSYHYYRQ